MSRLISFKRLQGFRSLVAVVLSIGFLVWAGSYVVGHQDEFRQAFAISWADVLLLFVLSLSNITMTGYFTRELLKSFGVDLAFRQWLGLTVVTAAGNYLLPFWAGAGIKSAYLNKVHRLSYLHFLAILVATYVLSFFVASLMALASLGLIAVIYHVYSLPLIAVLLALQLGSLVLLMLPPRLSFFNTPLLAWLADALEGWYEFRRDTWQIVKLCGLIAAILSTAVLSVYVSFKAVSGGIGILQAAFVALVAEMSVLISLTPGGLGVREALIVFTSQRLGVPLTQGLISATLLRLTSVILVFGMMPVLGISLCSRPGEDEKQASSEVKPDDSVGE